MRKAPHPHLAEVPVVVVGLVLVCQLPAQDDPVLPTLQYDKYINNVKFQKLGFGRELSQQFMGCILLTYSHPTESHLTTSFTSVIIITAVD